MLQSALRNCLLVIMIPLLVDDPEVLLSAVVYEAFRATEPSTLFLLADQPNPTRSLTSYTTSFDFRRSFPANDELFALDGPRDHFASPAR